MKRQRATAPSPPRSEGELRRPLRPEDSFEFEPHHCFACGELNEQRPAPRDPHGPRRVVDRDDPRAGVPGLGRGRPRRHRVHDPRRGHGLVRDRAWNVGRHRPAERRVPEADPDRASHPRRGPRARDAPPGEPDRGAVLDAATGEVLATAEGTFMALPADQLARLKARYGMRRTPGGSASDEPERAVEAKRPSAWPARPAADHAATTIAAREARATRAGRGARRRAVRSCRIRRAALGRVPRARGPRVPRGAGVRRAGHRADARRPDAAPGRRPPRVRAGLAPGVAGRAPRRRRSPPARAGARGALVRDHDAAAPAREGARANVAAAAPRRRGRRRLDHRRHARAPVRQGHPRGAVPLGGAGAADRLAVALGAAARRLDDRHDARTPIGAPAATARCSRTPCPCSRR